MKAYLRVLPFLFLPLGLASGCSGSSSGDAGPPVGTQGVGEVGVTLGSGGHPELATFSTMVSGIGLVRADGTRTASLMGGDTEVEWIGLGAAQRWLGRAEVPAGDYVGLYLRLDPRGTRGMRRGGEEVRFSNVVDEVELPFDGVLSVAEGGMTPGHLALDLPDSILLEGAPRFDPRGSAGVGWPVLPVDVFFGLVRSVGREGTLAVAAFADVELRHPLGPLDVSLAEDALLVDEDGAPFESVRAFLGALRNGLSLLELEGMLGEDSRFVATRIEVIDSARGTGSMPVRIEGEVLERERTGFLLGIRRILSGAEVARPVLATLDRPHSIHVGVDDMTHVVGPDGGEHGDGGRDLDAGRSVIVEFREFVAQPFPAGVILLRGHDSCLTGAMASRDAARSIVLILHPDSRTGDSLRIPVFLGSARIQLRTRAPAALGIDDLIEGMLAEACGEVHERAGERALEAHSLRVFPGLYTGGHVTFHDRARRVFGARGGEVRMTFGSLVHSGPVEVWLRDGVRIHGAATSVDALFDLLDAATHDAPVFVDVLGIGAEARGVVQAFELFVGRPPR